MHSFPYSLPTRPIGHSVNFIIICVVLVSLLSKSTQMRVLVFSSLLTHQSRDAVRRGYSFWPLDMSTIAIPYFVYFVLLTILPQINQWLVTFHEVKTVGDDQLGEGFGSNRDDKVRKHRQHAIAV